jgi:hypothetical protein
MTCLPKTVLEFLEQSLFTFAFNLGQKFKMNQKFCIKNPFQYQKPKVNLISNLSRNCKKGCGHQVDKYIVQLLLRGNYFGLYIFLHEVLLLFSVLLKLALTSVFFMPIKIFQKRAFFHDMTRTSEIDDECAQNGKNVLYRSLMARLNTFCFFFIYVNSYKPFLCCLYTFFSQN